MRSVQVICKSLYKAVLEANNKINFYLHEKQKETGHFYFAHSILQKEQMVNWKPHLVQSRQFNNLECNRLFNIPGHNFLKENGAAHDPSFKSMSSHIHYLVMRFLDGTSAELTRYWHDEKNNYVLVRLLPDLKPLAIPATTIDICDIQIPQRDSALKTNYQVYSVIPIRTPLKKVYSSSTGITASELPPEKSQKYLNKIKKIKY